MKMRGAAAAVAFCAIAVVTLGVHAVHSQEKSPPMVLRHVVFFKFKETATATDVRTVEAAFAALPSQLPDAIYDFEWGTDVGVENLSDGFTHCFQVTFLTANARDNYLVAGAHKKFTDLAGQHLEKATVIDYWTKP